MSCETQDAGLLSRVGLNDNKAGMRNLDREKINQVIYEASKGSKYFENEKKKDNQVDKRIAEQQRKITKITEKELKKAEVEADTFVQRLEQVRDMKHVIVHIDMDAFYAAVETRDDPSLQNKPMAVGSNSMLSTSNYIARRFGVRAAMPGFIAKKLCPQVVIIPPNFSKYTAVSKEVRNILIKYDENFCPMSLDEAYLDLTEHLKLRKHLLEEKRTVICRTCERLNSRYCHCDPNHSKQILTHEEGNKKEHADIVVELVEDSKELTDNQSVPQSNMETMSKQTKECFHRDSDTSLCSLCRCEVPVYRNEVFGITPQEAVREMCCRIEQRTQLTASAGIAPNTLLAKICSDQNKPNGQFSIPHNKEAIMAFMKDLPIRKVCGIGKVTEKMLQALDIVTCSHLYQRRALLYLLYSENSFEHFMRVSLGIGSTRVERDSERKSLSTEQTFNETSNSNELYEKCLELSKILASDLSKEQLKGRTVTVKLKTVDFDVKTRAQTLVNHTADEKQIYQVARNLLKTEIQAYAPKPFKLRLMGVRISNLLPCTQCKKQDTIDCFIKKELTIQNQSMSCVIDEPNKTSSEESQGQACAAVCPLKEQGTKRNGQSPERVFPESPSGHYCPICNRKCPNNLSLFNAHIDKCLLQQSGENVRKSRRTPSTAVTLDSDDLKPVSSKVHRKQINKNKMTQMTLASLRKKMEKPVQDDISDFSECKEKKLNASVLENSFTITPNQTPEGRKVNIQETIPKENSPTLEKQSECKFEEPLENLINSSSPIRSSPRKEVPSINIPTFQADEKNVNSYTSCIEIKSNSDVDKIHDSASLIVNDYVKQISEDSHKSTDFGLRESNLEFVQLGTYTLDQCKTEANKELDEQTQELKVFPQSLKDQNSEHWIKILESENKVKIVDSDSPQNIAKEAMSKQRLDDKLTKKKTKAKTKSECNEKPTNNLLHYFSPSNGTAVNEKPCPNPNVFTKTSKCGETAIERLSVSLSDDDNCQVISEHISPQQQKPSDSLLNTNKKSKRKTRKKLFSNETKDDIPKEVSLETCNENISPQTKLEVLSLFESDLNSNISLLQQPLQILPEETEAIINTARSNQKQQNEHFNDICDNTNVIIGKDNSEDQNKELVKAKSQSLSEKNIQSVHNLPVFTDTTNNIATTSQSECSMFVHNMNKETIFVKKEEVCSPQDSSETPRGLISPPAKVLLQKEIHVCPVCNSDVAAYDMSSFNEHVDLCLNKGTIREILLEQGEQLRRADTFKRRADTMGPVVKKRKKHLINSSSTPTIDSYFP